MNPLSNTITDMKLAPMREVSKTLQIRWYRCPVDKKILRGLMTPDDTRGLFMAWSSWPLGGNWRYRLLSVRATDVGRVCYSAVHPWDGRVLLHRTTS